MGGGGVWRVGSPRTPPVSDVWCRGSKFSPLFCQLMMLVVNVNPVNSIEECLAYDTAAKPEMLE